MTHRLWRRAFDAARVERAAGNHAAAAMHTECGEWIMYAEKHLSEVWDEGYACGANDAQQWRLDRAENPYREGNI